MRALDRYAGTPICGLLSAFDRLARTIRGNPAPGPPRRILVILLSEMGSLVLAQPMFARLRERYPEASIHALAFARNREVIDLLGLVPPANVLTLDDRRPGRFLADGLRVLRVLRRASFDVVIDCELFARISSILAYLSGARVRVGFHRHTQEGLYRGSFINRPVAYNPYRHVAAQFLGLAEAIGSRSVPLGKRMVTPPSAQVPVPVLPQIELAAAAAQLHADFPAIAGRRLVLVNPGGGLLPIRAWPVGHYAQLCAALVRRGFAVGVTGLAGDQPLARAITRHCADPLCVDLTGYTRSVRHLVALMHRAALMVTNDGGPGHFAALTPMPVLVLFGPETPALYAPLSPNAHSIHLDFGCSPCLTAYNHRNSPCDGDNQCLVRITPERVLARALGILGAGPASVPTDARERSPEAGLEVG